MRPRPIEEYHEDMGDVLWWRFPIEEAPYVGRPTDLGQTVEVALRGYDLDKLLRGQVGGWPGYHTHFTIIQVPLDPAGSGSTARDRPGADITGGAMG